MLCAGKLPSLLLAAYLALTLVACSGGGGGGPSCKFTNPATMASTSPWPKFRHDAANTGTLTLTDAAAFGVLTSAAGDKRARVFPDGDPVGSFSASPVISDDSATVYVGSNNGILYALHAADWTQNLSFNLVAADPIVSAGLVARRSDLDAIFVGTLSGLLYGVDSTSTLQESHWPFSGGVALDKSPNLGADGTVYTGSSNGLLIGVCPNGVLRFSISLGDVTPVAVGPDQTVYVAADDMILRSFRNDGLPRWAVAASRPIATAPVVEIVDGSVAAIYVADLGGRVFKIDDEGGYVDSFYFAGGSPIRSSPALADGILYFGSNDGNIHAISSATGNELAGWPILVGGGVLSSPAVAVFNNDHVIVVGSDDGGVYFIHNDGTAPTVARYSIGSIVRSSPAIGFDGTVYVGSEDGYVYAINDTVE